MQRSKFSIFTLLLLLSTPARTTAAAAPLSFNMSSITLSDTAHLVLTGDASISDQGIQVTPIDGNGTSRAGRATYTQQLHLWDRESRNMSDFTTHFSFLIDANGSRDRYYGDGLAFFLAPPGSTIQSWSYGGGLGLGNGGTPVSSSSLEAFVAVELDTFQNPDFDPPYSPHVGIDANSMKSIATAKWDNNVSYGVVNEVWISYTASSKEMRVDFTGSTSNGTQRGSLVAEVDLRDFLPENVTVGFSASTGALFETHNVKSWDFSSTDVQYGGSDSKKKKNKALEALKFLAGLVVLTLIPLWCCRKNKTVIRAGNECKACSCFIAGALLWVLNKCRGLGGDDASMDKEFMKESGPRRFSHKELVVATDKFKVKLGEGGFGNVYKGFLKETNVHVAVKKVSKDSKQGRKEYESEVKIISQLRYKNLVQLIGWCHQRRELLLVYELMPNGSLDSHLFRQDPPFMSWEMRFKIARELGLAVSYLHEGLKDYVVHRDIKSSNIMLDSDFTAKLGDFGLARLVDRNKDSKTTVPAGTPGYMDFEHLTSGRASKPNDVFSFGVVLLELACGRRAVVNQEALLVLVRQLDRDGRLLDAADPKLPLSRTDAPKVHQLLAVGLSCAHPDSNQRPSIGQATQDLDFELGSSARRP